jgi:amino acid transporter
MQKAIIIVAAFFVVTLFLKKLKANKDSIYYHKNGTLYLGFLGVGVITVMDVITSIFYAPAESFRFVGYDTILFMPMTAIIVAAFAFSMTEIARIMEKFGYKGGGVYSFSYMVFGRSVSLVAAASILVDFVNTAAISAIAAIENVGSIFTVSAPVKIALEIAIIWVVATLNILGIKQNSKVTFYLFAFICYVLGVTILLGFYNLDAKSVNLIFLSLSNASYKLTSGGLLDFSNIVVIGIGSTILAYSGIESVLQTGKLTESWRTIKSAYIFLIVFIGIVTPTLSILALVSVENPLTVGTTLMPTFANIVGGALLTFFIAVVAFLALVFAINTATVAGVELISVMADKFGLKKPQIENKHGAKYRLIIFAATFFSIVILMTGGSQAMVADMYAIGLVATFVINLAALLVFRFTQGFSHVKEYKSSFFKNIALFALFVAVFIYLISHKQNGAIFWALASIFVLLIGLGLKDFVKEKKDEGSERFDNKFSVVTEVGTIEANEVHIVFLRPFEKPRHVTANSVFVTFGLGRMPAPDKMARNHFLLPLNSYLTMDVKIEELLHSLEDWYSEKTFVVHFNWPTSQWRKRLYLAVMINRIMKLPTKLPHLRFAIEYHPDV